MILQQNELIVSDGKIGFLEPEQEPINFLTIDDIEYDYPVEDQTAGLPQMQALIRMGNNKSIYQREAYSFLSLMGDFGGFTDAIFMLFGLFASSFSAKMFTSAIA